MNKKLLAVAIAATTVTVAGCGDKSEAEIALELRKAEMAQELALEREKTKQIEAENQVSDTYIEYEIEVEEDDEDEVIEEIEEVIYVAKGTVDLSTDTYTSTGGSSGQYVDWSGDQEAIPEPTPVVNATNPVVQPDGFSGGDMLLGAAAGFAAGYIVNESLSSGHSVGTCDNGRTCYYDPKGKEITKAEYDGYKAKHPVKSAINQRVSDGKAAARRAGTAIAESKAGKTAKEGYSKAKTNAKKVVDKGKEKAKAAKNKIKEKVREYKNNNSSSSSSSRPSRGRR